MAKKTETKIIRPIEAINSLKEYNDRVILLIQNCKTLINLGKIDKDMLPIFESNVKSLDEFYL